MRFFLGLSLSLVLFLSVLVPVSAEPVSDLLLVESVSLSSALSNINVLFNAS